MTNGEFGMWNTENGGESCECSKYQKYRIISSMHYPPKARVKEYENKPEISSFIL
jgi:hypothetical protein